MFEKRWQVISLIIALLVCSSLIAWQVKDINMKGIACLKKPACPISIYEQQTDIQEAQEEMQKVLKEFENGN